MIFTVARYVKHLYRSPYLWKLFSNSSVGGVRILTSFLLSIELDGFPIFRWPLRVTLTFSPQLSHPVWWRHSGRRTVTSWRGPHYCPVHSAVLVTCLTGTRSVMLLGLRLMSDHFLHEAWLVHFAYFVLQFVDNCVEMNSRACNRLFKVQIYWHG